MTTAYSHLPESLDHLTTVVHTPYCRGDTHVRQPLEARSLRFSQTLLGLSYRSTVDIFNYHFISFVLFLIRVNQ